MLWSNPRISFSRKASRNRTHSQQQRTTKTAPAILFFGRNFICPVPLLHQYNEVDEDHATASLSQLSPLYFFAVVAAKGRGGARGHVLSQSSHDINRATGAIGTCARGHVMSHIIYLVPGI